MPVGPQIRRWWRASGTARPTGRGAPASETPERAGVRAGDGDGGGRRDGAGAGAGQAGQRRVGGQPGDRGELGHRQQVAPAQPAGGDRGGGVAQAAAGQPVPPGVQGGGRGQGVGQAAQPRGVLRGGGAGLPPPGPGGDGRGGGGDGVADEGFPLRAGELAGGLADLGGQLGIGAGRGPAAPASGVAAGAGQVQQAGGEPGGLPGALLAGGAAGLAEPGSGDRAGEHLDDGVLAVGQAGGGAGQRPQRRVQVVAGATAGGSRGGPAAVSRRRSGRRAAAGGLAGAVRVCAPGQAASTARSIRPGGMVPGTHRRIARPAVVPPAQVYSQPRCGCPCHSRAQGGRSSPVRCPHSAAGAAGVGLRRGEHRDRAGGGGEGGVLAAVQPLAPGQRSRLWRRPAAGRPPGRNAPGG